MDIANLVVSPALWWVIAFAVLAIFELMTMGLTTIWFAGGALVAALVAVLGGGFVLQIVTFLIVSIILLLVTRPIAVKYFNKSRVKTNADGLVGQAAVVTKTINNVKQEGTVVVNGMEWTARTKDSSEEIAEGKQVEIEEIQGVKLIVKVKEENQ